MEEQFKYLTIKYFTDYKISNYGYVLSPKNKVLKPYKKKDGQYFIDIKKIKKGKVKHRLSVGIARLVYLYFVGDIDKITKVLHRDNDSGNNRSDNLYISRTTPSQYAIEMYEKNAIACIKHYCIYRWKDCHIQGLDLDNIIGEALVNCWQQLYRFDLAKIGFYRFCINYCKEAYRKEYNNRRKFGFVSDYALYEIGII